MHDLLIRNALIFDGTGAPPTRGDLAVDAGRIAAIGSNGSGAHEVIDADGLALMPGIVDTHTHYDAQITWDPLVDPSPALGVTTVVVGNCGFTIAPCRPADRDLVMRNLTHVEGMSLEALRTGIRWDFETFPEYLEMLERRGVGPNVAAFVGHSSVRTWVMGEDAPRRAATADEIARMRAIVQEALQAGAVGFSTTTSLQHNGENGIPMPSRLADDQELRTLVNTLREQGRGVFMLTKAAETSIPYLESLAADSGRPVVIAALLHDAVMPEAVFDDLGQIAQARSRGREMLGAISVCPLTFEFTMASPYPFEGLAEWKPAMQCGHDRLPDVLADPAFRAAVKAEIDRPARRLFTGEWHKIRVIQTADPANRALEGQTVADLARRDDRHPLDWMLDFSLSENLDTVFTAALQNSDEEAVGRLINNPNSLVSLSDAGAHLTFFCDAGFGLYLLGHWVRERRALPLEAAVHKLTGAAADLFGLRDRGHLKVGAWADLLLFDPATVGREPAQRLYDLPAGASRLVTPSTGVHGVWVNGRRIADAHGVVADAGTPGQILREFAA